MYFGDHDTILDAVAFLGMSGMQKEPFYPDSCSSIFMPVQTNAYRLHSRPEAIISPPGHATKLPFFSFRNNTGADHDHVAITESSAAGC